MSKREKKNVVTAAFLNEKFICVAYNIYVVMFVTILIKCEWHDRVEEKKP